MSSISQNLGRDYVCLVWALTRWQSFWVFISLLILIRVFPTIKFFVSVPFSHSSGIVWVESPGKIGNNITLLITGNEESKESNSHELCPPRGFVHIKTFLMQEERNKWLCGNKITLDFPAKLPASFYPQRTCF